MAEACPFCDIVLLGSPTQERFDGVFTLKPKNPVTLAHTLVIPNKHVSDVTEDPEVTAAVFRVVAEVARRLKPCNVITSVGSEATQTVFHMHVHVVPRREGDGLVLPWSFQQSPTAEGDAE